MEKIVSYLDLTNSDVTMGDMTMRTTKTTKSEKKLWVMDGGRIGVLKNLKPDESDRGKETKVGLSLAAEQQLDLLKSLKTDNEILSLFLVAMIAARNTALMEADIYKKDPKDLLLAL